MVADDPKFPYILENVLKVSFSQRDCVLVIKNICVLILPSEIIKIMAEIILTNDVASNTRPLAESILTNYSRSNIKYISFCCPQQIIVSITKSLLFCFLVVLSSRYF